MGFGKGYWGFIGEELEAMEVTAEVVASLT